MKALDIAFKDMLRSSRSAFNLVMMFVAPLLITGLIYLAFGGAGSSEIKVAKIDIAVVNLDAPPADAQFRMGDQLVEILSADSLNNLLSVTAYENEALARQAILDKDISLAVIIPADLTAAAITPGMHTNVALIHDPVSTLPPAIVGSIVNEHINDFNGAKIAVEVISTQLTGMGLQRDGSLTGRIVQSYTDWLINSTHDGSGQSPLIKITIPSTSGKTQSSTQLIAGQIMAGMIIFFVFYTGALTAQSIIREHEDQTLARLMTTPTTAFAVLTGKLLASMFLIGIQIAVLMVLSHFFFGIAWGDPLSIISVCVALTFLASAFGLFLMSFVKNMRQTGLVLGGALTVLGMLGGLYTQGFQSLPKAFEIANLFTPHGWAMKAYKIAMGAVPGDLWLHLLVMFAIGAVSLAIGMLLFRRRFA